MISVCIATYNGEKYIKEQIQSILNQIDYNDEIIISDDHSTDSTISIIKELKDERIKIVYNTKDKGYTSNFENALNYVKGDYIFLSDQDDIWLKNKVEYCMKYLQKYDLVVSDAIIVDSDGKETCDSYYKNRKVYKTLLGNLYKFGYLGCCMCFKRKVMEQALPFPPNRVFCTHDNWLFILAKTFFKVKISNEKLIKYRRHNNNTSSGGFKNTTSLIFKLSYRIYLIIYLIKCVFRNHPSNEIK